MILVPLLLVGCTAAAKNSTMIAPGDQSLPAWVMNPAGAYPEIRYMSAVGTGRALDMSEADALNKLARRFSVLLQSRETQLDDYQAQMGASVDGTQWERTTSLLADIQLSTDQQLLNAQIAERFKDDQGMFYALAVLERIPTARLYAEQMRINRQLAEAHYKAAMETPAGHKFSRLAHLRTARLAVSAYEDLRQVHDVLVGHRPDLTLGDPDFAAIKTAFAEARETITARLIWDRDVPPAMRAEIPAVLNKLGVTTVDAGPCDLVLRVNYLVNLRNSEQYAVVYADWRITVAVRDQADRRQIATLTYASQDGGANRAGALRQAERQAIRLVAASLPHDLTEALYNDEAL